MQINFCKCDLALSNCQACNNATPERPVIKYKACNNCFAKLSIVFVGTYKCDCLPFLKLVFTAVQPAIAYIN